MYDTILFDIDGVMLSEERYFDASALTVFELLCSPQYLGISDPGLPHFHTDLSEPEIRWIRRRVFADDVVLHAMMARGVNANWDMVYLQTAFQITRLVGRWRALQGRDAVRGELARITRHGWNRAALQRLGEALQASGIVSGAPPSSWPVADAAAGGAERTNSEPDESVLDFAAFVAAFADCTSKQEMFERLDALLAEAVGLETGGERALLGSDASDISAFDAERALWMVGQQAFQEWYLGDKHLGITHQPGKRGFLSDEVPIVPPAEFARLLAALRDNGVRIGIATGRPDIETFVPLEEQGWLSFFRREHITTATDVLCAEQAHPEAAPLAKPHPYSYLRSYLGSPEPGVVLSHPLPLPEAEARRTLIVGDSVADLLAARAIGCDFAAVLTGLEGQAARPQFEAHGCVEILDNVLELWQKVHAG